MEKAMEILEFAKIKEQILKFNINQLSYKKVADLSPLTFPERIEEELQKTEEGIQLITNGMIPSLNQLPDVESSLSKVAKGGLLSTEEIYNFLNQQEVVGKLIQFRQEKEVINLNLVHFNRYVSHLTYLSDLKETIQFCIAPNFTLYDHASSKLKSIRKQMKKIEEEIKDKLNHYLKNYADKLSDQYIATKNEHLVLPVKAAYKNQIQGIVIDVSSTNQTIFIEPYGISERHAQLEQLHGEEEIEIQRIIRALCEMIQRHHLALSTNNDLLAEISFMLLKGRYGLENNYEIASLSEKQEIELIDARHPLIKKEQVVGNDFYLGGDYQRIIVISGPNAGGKTVALKTVGLLVLMNQCGLPLPVKKARLGIFRNLFVDIGDAQSIEQSLSGFSSHIANVIHILDRMDDHSLILLDELGGKTDPKEGEALAKAILETIEEASAIALITTHYIGIKDYAKKSSQITLASMSFDEKTLVPTYRLLLNLIGRSYALEISARLGLSSSIIEKARQYKDSQENQLDHLIDELNQKLKEESIRLEQTKKLNQELEEEKRQLQEEKRKMAQKQEQWLKETSMQKEALIEEAIEKINEIVEQFKQQAQDGYKHHLKTDALNQLEQLQDDRISTNKEKKYDCFSVGDFVILKSIGKMAMIQEIKGRQATITADRVTMRVDLSDLEKASSADKKQIRQKSVRISNSIDLSRSVPLSLNIVGQHVEEGLILLRQYLDQAMLAHHHQVSIIHGFGTGALRKAVHEYLRKCKYVEEFHFGMAGEGGAGATIVTLK